MSIKKFKNTVVIFIDILGTRDRHQFNEWFKIASIFHDTAGPDKKLDYTLGHAGFKRELHMLSDCAFIIYDYNDGVEEDRKDRNELMSIACRNTEKMLYEFLRNGFIARGAVTYGNIYYEADRNIFFGPAMNKAYNLESHEAKFPRVIIDPEFAELLVNYNNTRYLAAHIEKHLNGENLKKDDDGLYFIHYLNRMQSGEYQMEDELIVIDTLDLCSKERDKEREPQKLKNSIKEKYDWLEKYVESSRYRGAKTEDVGTADTKTIQQLAEELEMTEKPTLDELENKINEQLKNLGIRI